jgi:predicted GTPase
MWRRPAIIEYDYPFQVRTTPMAAFLADSLGEREFHQACAEGVRRSLEGRHLLKTQIDALLARLAAATALSRESGELGGAGEPTDAARVWFEEEEAAAAAIAGELTGLLGQQLAALDTFNVVLFGRTGTGKSALVEALTSGDGASASPYGESDWTKEVKGTEWHGCQVFDTPGIGGWDKNVPPAQLEGARLAAASADVVVLCFDNQNQRASEFQKVADWIGAYDKAAVAVLNVRNEKWGIADLMPDPADRRGCSVQVAQHVQHLRGELARIGLNRIPVIAVHARNAMFACATEPYRGPAQGTRTDRLGRLGAARLYQCSNVPALEGLLITVIRHDATPLRLASVYRLVVGAIQEARRRTTELVRRAEELAAVHEAGVALALEILGLPEPAEDDVSYAGFRELLARLEELREGRFQVPLVARTERYAADLISSKLTPLEAAAQVRADAFVEVAMLQRQTPRAGAFEAAVFAPGDMNTATAAALSDFHGYLARRFELIAQDAKSDLRRLAGKPVRIRASAGRALYRTGTGGQAAGIGAVVAGVAYAAEIAAIANAWNPVGWTAFGVAGAAIAAGMILERSGVSSRRKAVDRRERASGEARADGREAVRDTFTQLELLLTAEFDSLRRRALVGNLAHPLAQAIALRRISWAGTARTNLLTQFLDQVAPAARIPRDLMSQAVRECETRHNVHDAAGRRWLWLGESWLADPAGRARARATRAPARPEVGDELKRFAAAHRPAPRPRSGQNWLKNLSRELEHDPDAQPLLSDLHRLARSDHPRVVICGDYDSGKSALIARLYQEARQRTPETLTVSAAPATRAVTEYRWEGFTLVDTPGFQADLNGPDEATIMEIASAAVVLLVFTTGLALGDRTDLIRTLYGNPALGLPGRSGHTLLVINRADELGADPADAGPEFALLCARKRAQLLDSVTTPGHGPPPGHAVCVAAAPYGSPLPEPWDGMSELAQALKAARRRLGKNASAVTILTGGLARLGALTSQMARDLPPLHERAGQLRMLEQDVSQMLSEIAALSLERRAALPRDIGGLIDGLISRTLTERDASRRQAIVRRLEKLPEDAEFRKIVEAWTGETATKVAALEQAIGRSIGRRLGAREFSAELPELSSPGDARALERAPAGKAIGSGLAKASGALQKLERFTGEAAQTSLLGRIVRVGGPALAVAGAGFSTWRLVKDVRGDSANERKRDEVIRGLQHHGVAWSQEICAHDGALARLAEQAGLLREVTTGTAEESREPASAASQLNDRIAHYRRLAAEAAASLGIDWKDTP